MTEPHAYWPRSVESKHSRVKSDVKQGRQGAGEGRRGAAVGTERAGLVRGPGPVKTPGHHRGSRGVGQLAWSTCAAAALPSIPGRVISRVTAAAGGDSALTPTIPHRPSPARPERRGAVGAAAATPSHRPLRELTVSRGGVGHTSSFIRDWVFSGRAQRQSGWRQTGRVLLIGSTQTDD